MDYSFTDDAGFWRSSVTEHALEYMPQHVKDKLIPSVPPEESAGLMKAWKWSGTAWEAADSLTGATWYNPIRTAERHVAASHNDVPPRGWILLPPGVHVDLTEHERVNKLWDKVRAERDALLTGTDWTQLPDVPAATRQRYVKYRQSLRDITNQPDPTAITWPDKP